MPKQKNQKPSSYEHTKHKQRHKPTRIQIKGPIRPAKKIKIKKHFQKPQINNVSNIDICPQTQKAKTSSPHPNITHIKFSGFDNKRGL
jgi:hypothetical protein